MFKDKVDQIVAATARLLLRQDRLAEASIVTHSRTSIHGPWDQGDFATLWNVWLHLPIDVYAGLEGRGASEQIIDDAMREVVNSVSADDTVNVSIKVDAEIDYIDDWRREMGRILSGETISNQGRVRSSNVATIQHDGLLFRSEPEVAFYRAAKRKGLTLAPLPVFIQGGASYRRAEPDFVVIKDGLTLIVELDGRRVHRESPVDAQQRLAFLTDQGVQMHRIEANNCLTDEDAAKCVNEVINKIERIRKLR
jgi:hypothetical protein